MLKLATTSGALGRYLKGAETRSGILEEPPDEVIAIGKFRHRRRNLCCERELAHEAFARLNAPVTAPPVRREARSNIQTCQSIGRRRSSRGGSLEHGKLMAERENFRRELEPKADSGSKRGQQGDE